MRGIRKTLEQFISEAVLVHGDKYTYANITYTNNKAKVPITCSTHGVFLQRAGDHLRGQGCPNCAHSAKHDKLWFIELATLKHGDAYDYSNFTYTGIHKPSAIYCKLHNYTFYQAAHAHAKQGKGCPKCANTRRGGNLKHGFDRSGILYIVFLHNIQMYKIGITHYNPHQRFSGKGLNVEVVYEYLFDTIAEAYAVEQYLLQISYHSIKYYGPKIIKEGNSELLHSYPISIDEDIVSAINIVQPKLASRHAVYLERQIISVGVVA